MKKPLSYSSQGNRPVADLNSSQMNRLLLQINPPVSSQLYSEHLLQPPFSSCLYFQWIARIFPSKFLFPMYWFIPAPTPAGTLWEHTGHFSQGSRQANCRSPPLLCPLKLILQSHPSSAEDHLLQTPFMILHPYPVDHRSSPPNFLLPTHCLVPGPNSSRHSLGTHIPLWPWKHVD